MKEHTARLEAFAEDEEVYFLPPRSFLKRYSLLVEATYLTRQPEPEVKHWMKRGGVKLPVRNYQAYKALRRVDKWLYRLDSQMSSYMNKGWMIQDPDIRGYNGEA